MNQMHSVNHCVVFLCVQLRRLQNHPRHHVQLMKFMTLVEQPVPKLVTVHHLLVHSSVLSAVGVQVAL